MKLIGHRGWRARFPDNVLAGFVAVSSFVDAVELDVRRSADGKLVLAHDPELGGLVVADTPWAVLADLDLGAGNHPALLDEVLAALPDTPAHIEVKNLPGQPGFEPDHRLALEAALRSRPGDTVTSFNPLTLSAVRRLFPDVRTGLIVAGGDLEEAVEICHAQGHQVLAPSQQMIASSVRRLDLEVCVWTVDDPARAGELVELGVSAIISDDAPRLAAAIRSEA
ncbi:MAG: glycerophosphodiester phosphodiesterase [Acidimicrobiia bacterium]